MRDVLVRRVRAIVSDTAVHVRYVDSLWFGTLPQMHELRVSHRPDIDTQTLNRSYCTDRHACTKLRRETCKMISISTGAFSAESPVQSRHGNTLDGGSTTLTTHKGHMHQGNCRGGGEFSVSWCMLITRDTESAYTWVACTQTYDSKLQPT